MDLIDATIDADIERVQELLENGANPNVKDYDGSTPLMIATRKGETNMVKLLLDKGADINIQDSDGKNALIYERKSEV